MAWKDMVPMPPLADQLAKSFFPKWTQVLVAWLTGMPNYDEITRWYLGWKAQIPEKMLPHPLVKGWCISLSVFLFFYCVILSPYILNGAHFSGL